MRDGFNGNKTNRNGSILFCICYSQLKIADRGNPIGDFRLFVYLKYFTALSNSFMLYWPGTFL